MKRRRNKLDVVVALPKYIGGNIVTTMIGRLYDFALITDEGTLDSEPEYKFREGSNKKADECDLVSFNEVMNLLNAELAHHGNEDNDDLESVIDFKYIINEFKEAYNNAIIDFIYDFKLEVGSVCYVILNDDDIKKKILSHKYKIATIEKIEEGHNAVAVSKYGVSYEGVIYEQHYSESFGRYAFVSPKFVRDTLFERRKELCKELGDIEGEISDFIVAFNMYY